MQTCKEGRDFIAMHEGKVMKSYLDPIGLLTGGVGHLYDEAEREQFPLGTELSADQVDTWLLLDLAEAETAIKRYVTVELTQQQSDALASFIFNVGVSAFKNSTLLKRLNAGDFKGAAAQFEKWIYADGEVLPGLVKRRKAERHLFEKGEYDG